MELSSATFDRLRNLAHQVCGLVLGDDKSYLIQHRLEPLVRERGLRSFEDLCATLADGRNTQWNNRLIEALTTRETSFFRDGHPFETLRCHVLPSWSSQAPSARRRVWSAGSATGQEAYSLAMLACEYPPQSAEQHSRLPNISILATDICNSALEVAHRGVYASRDVARGLTTSQLHRYFDPLDNAWQVRAPLRGLVEFRRLNLIEPLVGLGQFDLILCRNVLIYFDEPTRRRLCNEFHQLLASGGWLLVGAAETLYGICDAFESVRIGDTLLYRKPDVSSARTRIDT